MNFIRLHYKDLSRKHVLKILWNHAHQNVNLSNKNLTTQHKQSSWYFEWVDQSLSGK